MDCLAMLDNCRIIMNNSMVNLLDTKIDANANSQNLTNYRNQINTCKSDIKALIQPKLFFLSIGRLKTVFSFLQQNLNQENVFINNINSQITEFEDVYQKFIQDYSYSSTVELVNSGTNMFHSLKSIEDVTNLIEINLKNNYEHDSSLGCFSLLLHSEYTYNDFITKLEILQKIYSELCFLLHISESDFPLRIAKIESGSLFVKIFGEPKVIQIISDLIKDTIGFLYRNTTTEGKIESIPRKTEAIESILKLREKLQEAGLEVDELNESIEKSAILIAEDLNGLLVGERGVELNGEILQAGNYKTQKLLGTSKGYQLEGGKDN